MPASETAFRFISFESDLKQALLFFCVAPVFQCSSIKKERSLFLIKLKRYAKNRSQIFDGRQ